MRRMSQTVAEDLYRVLRHRVQILTRLGLPPSWMVAFWTLADHRCLVCRLEKLTLLPDCPDFKQISHLAMVCL